MLGQYGEKVSKNDGGFMVSLSAMREKLSSSVKNEAITFFGGMKIVQSKSGVYEKQSKETNVFGD